MREILNKAVKNAGLLLAGNISGSLIGLAAFALTARALGAVQFGNYAILTSFVMLLDGLVNFQSWQAIIKFSGGELEPDGTRRIRELINFGISLDALTALTGTVVAFAGVFLMGRFQGWDLTLQMTALLGCLVILTNLTGAPIAVLRIAGRFDILSRHRVVESTAKLGGAGIVFVFGKGLCFFFLAWVVGQSIGNAFLIVSGAREAYRRKVWTLDEFRFVTKLPDAYGIWKFNILANIQSSIRLGTTTVDTLLVGALLGPESAGVFKFIKQLATSAAMLPGALYQVVYPVLVKLWASQSRKLFYGFIGKLSLGILALVVIGWAIFGMLGEELIALVGGGSFRNAHHPMAIYLIGTSIDALSFSLQPAMLAVGAQGTALAIMGFTTAVYLAGVWHLSQEWGVFGSTSAYALFYALWAVLMLSGLYKRTRVTRNGCP